MQRTIHLIEHEVVCASEQDCTSLCGLAAPNHEHVVIRDRLLDHLQTSTHIDDMSGVQASTMQAFACQTGYCL